MLSSIASAAAAKASKPADGKTKAQAQETSVHPVVGKKPLPKLPVPKPTPKPKASKSMPSSASPEEQGPLARHRSRENEIDKNDFFGQPTWSPYINKVKHIRI